MAENARIRGDDLRYTQQQETHEHVQWLDAQLAMVDKVRTVFMEERRKVVLPVEQISKEQMPRVVKQGPVNG
jgi:DNA-directed RNA polymerase subunit H (RpoH/RPB5)